MVRSRGRDKPSNLATSPSKPSGSYNTKRSKILEPLHVHSVNPHDKAVVNYRTNKKKKSSNPSGSREEPRIEILQSDGTIRTHRGSLIPPGSTAAGDSLAAQASKQSAGEDFFSPLCRTPLKTPLSLATGTPSHTPLPQR